MAEVHIPHPLPEGAVEGHGAYAVGNNGDHFAVTRRCRHLRADLANGSIDDDGWIAQNRLWGVYPNEKVE